MKPVDLNFLKTLTDETYRENFPFKTKAYLREKVRELPPAEFTVIHFYFWDNCTFNEIAKKLNMKYSNVETIYECALIRLKEIIADDLNEDVASISMQ
mgnify:CR=1 FL=1